MERMLRYSGQKLPKENLKIKLSKTEKVGGRGTFQIKYTEIVMVVSRFYLAIYSLCLV